ncbi:MAG: HNH endonuclease [Prevotellaceae bacterium]|jgi:hypothetical protein|nr:HNH endonuclease [Prevotellaceae bacterium]
MKTINEAAQEYAAQDRTTRSEHAAFAAGVEFAQRCGLEEWRDIKGYEGQYLISNHGRIMSLARKGKNNKNAKTFVCQNNGNPYLHIGLTNREGKRKNYDIHRLVACAFIPNPEHKCDVNHIDGNKSNNHIGNLEWATRSENVKHSYDTLGQKSARFWLGKKGANNPCSIPIKEIDGHGDAIIKFNSIREAADLYGLDRRSVSLCCKGRLRQTGGRRFRFNGDQLNKNKQESYGKIQCGI